MSPVCSGFAEPSGVRLAAALPIAGRATGRDSGLERCAAFDARAGQPAAAELCVADDAIPTERTYAQLGSLREAAANIPAHSARGRTRISDEDSDHHRED